MPKLPKNNLILLVAILLILLVGSFGLYSYFFSKSDIALEVNGQTVSKEFFNHRIEIQTNFYVSVSPDPAKLKTVKKDEEDSIIAELLGEEKLKKLGKLITTTEIESALESKTTAFKKNNYTVSYEDYLKNTYKMTLEDERYVIKKDLIKQRIIGFQTQKHFYGIWLKRDIPFDAPETATTEQKQADTVLAEKANQILGQVRAGKDFATLVAQNSDDLVSKAKGGDVGFYPSEEIIKGTFKQPPFPSMAVLASAYSKMSVGQVSLFDYPSGFAILKVTEIKGDWPYKDYDDFVQQDRKQAVVKIYV